MVLIALIDKWECVISNESLAYIHNVQRAERKDDGTPTYDLSAAQKASSSTCPLRNMYHMRRMLAITAWQSQVPHALVALDSSEVQGGSLYAFSTITGSSIPRLDIRIHWKSLCFAFPKAGSIWRSSMMVWCPSHLFVRRIPARVRDRNLPGQQVSHDVMDVG